jgi:hypothetical protein
VVNLEKSKSYLADDQQKPFVPGKGKAQKIIVTESGLKKLTNL